MITHAALPLGSGLPWCRWPLSTRGRNPGGGVYELRGLGALLAGNTDTLRPVDERDHRVARHMADENDDDERSDSRDDGSGVHCATPSVRIGLLL